MIHKIAHTGEKPFRCTQCDNTFSHNSALKMNLKAHKGEKPYQGDLWHKSHRGIHLKCKLEYKQV